jgi:hypothetical protein
MSVETSLIFGLQAGDTTTVTITAVLKNANEIPPALIVREKTGETTFTEWDPAVEYHEEQWTVELPKGDYILRIEGWFADSLAVALDHAETFLFHGPPSNHVTRAWQASGAPISDPKNPWPPPSGNAVDSTDGWYISNLHDLRAQISNPKSSPKDPEPERCYPAAAPAPA